jgi:transcriptional regulator with XRE-family HTH domain
MKARGFQDRKIRRALANVCGITYQAVSQWFDDQTKRISPEYLAKIADEYGTSTDWLISEVGSMDGAQLVANDLAQGQSLQSPALTNSDPIASEIVMIAKELTPGEWAYLKEQAQQMIARRMPAGAAPQSGPGVVNAVPTSVVKEHFRSQQTEDNLRDNAEHLSDLASVQIGKIRGPHKKSRATEAKKSRQK